MGAPRFLNELDLAASLSAGAAIAIVQDGQTLRTTPEAIITQAATFTQSGSGASTESVQAVIRRIVRDVKGYGALGDGSTDDKAAIVAAIAACGDGDILYFPPSSSFYRSSGEIEVSGKRIHFFGHGAEVRFDDAAINGFHFNTSSQRCTVEGLYLRSDETTTPLITLIKNDGTSAYFTVKHCKFAYADIAISLDNTYVIKLHDNEYSNCDTFIYATNAGGSTADINLAKETFGSTAIGTDPCVDIDAAGVQMNGCYWETQSQTKKSLRVQTGSQDFFCSGFMFDSGEIEIQASVVANLRIRALDCYDSVNNRFLRVSSGSRVTFSGSDIRCASVPAGVFGVSSSGTFIMSGGSVEKYATGISVAGLTAVNGVLINTCTTGIQSSSGSTGRVSGNTFNGNTTDINKAGGSVDYTDNTGVVTVTETAKAGANRGNTSLQMVELGHPTGVEPLMDDFLGATINANKWQSAVGTDGACVAPAILADQLRGFFRMTTGAGAGADMATNGVVLVSALNWRASMGGLVAEFRVQASAVNSMAMFVGFTDTIALEMPFTLGASDTLTSNATDAVGVLYDSAADTDNWWAVGVANNVDATKQNLGVAPAGSTIEIWRIELSTAGAATFYRNGTAIGSTMSGAVTASVALTPVVAAFSRQASSKSIDGDYIRVQAYR